MNFVAGLLTAVLVLDSLFLILLILVQLPKKEAGVGQAFGGGTTDALFGAGTGNALTNMTKYAAGIFLTLCLVLYIMGGQARKAGSGVRDALKKEQSGSVLPPTKAPSPATLTAPAVTLPPQTILTNAPTATNAPAPKAAPAPAVLTATNAAAPKAAAPVATPPSTTPPVKK
ncbi:MAG: preprotein translocase subunit SecG [Pedosphaera sp. Tous-C6FEB]|nr:MAG: preprotein translocase subunit SecG [Pedosphaera sp. Tous-C6FEB]